MPVDSFKHLSRLVARYYKLTQVEPELPIPWTPLARPLDQCRFGLMTSGGLYHEGHEPPFDAERERQEPAWGAPSFRTIPSDIRQEELSASHLHLNTHDVLEDVNTLLLTHRLQTLAAEGRIGSLARDVYSSMGYQGFPADQSGWRDVHGPQVAARLIAEDVDCVSSPRPDRSVQLTCPCWHAYLKQPEYPPSW